MIYPAYNSDISMQLTATLTVTLIGFLATLILLLAYSMIRSCAGGTPFPVCFRRGAWFLLTAPAGMLIATEESLQAHHDSLAVRMGDEK